MKNKIDLLFHIGFPKCASTTLQNQVFRYEPGYLGTYNELPKNQNFAKKFQALSPVGPRLWGDMKKAEKWAYEVRDYHKIHCPSTARLIASSELFTNRNKLNDRPIVGFLKEFKKRIWHDGEVKVLVILRNPAERIASSYAQTSASRPFASQDDFVKHVELALQSKSRVNYAEWVSDLYDQIGRENVCVLLMEEINELSFWEELKEFCCLELFKPISWIDDNEGSNTRKISDNTWKLRIFESGLKAKVTTLKIFGILLSSFVAPKLRQKAFKKFENAVHKYYKQRYGEGNNSTRGSITLTNELKYQIQEAYSSQTNELSDMLHKDLKQLGY